MHDRLQTTADVDHVDLKTFSVTAQGFPACCMAPAPQLIDGFLADMQRAAIDPDASVLPALVAEMRASSVSAKCIAEGYVPAAARLLGESWTADVVDFRAVSIGSSRLQSLLRQLAPEWGQTHLPRTMRVSSILVLVPKGSQHTLGAAVLAGQLRHREFSVVLELEADNSRLQALAARHAFAGIMISASARESLELLAQLVQEARSVLPATPILIGGNILDQSCDIQTLTGADLATRDLDAALAFCGLSAGTTVRQAAQV